MTISSLWKLLDTARVFPRVEVVSEWVKNVMGDCNALYEALWDVACPDGSQLWKGHDHGLEGGAPLARNAQVHGGDYQNPIYTNANLAWNQSIPLGMNYVSPRLASYLLDRHQLLIVCAKATGNKIYLKSGVGEYSEGVLEVSTTPQWIFLRRPITADTLWEPTILIASPVEGASGSTQLDVYEIGIIETYDDSQPVLGVRPLASFGVALNTVLSYFETLCLELADAYQWLDSDTLKRLYSFANGLLEGTQNREAPGAATQYIQGHDHLQTAFSGQGGRPLPMGKVFSCFDGSTGWNTGQYWLSCLTSAGNWVNADNANLPVRTDGSIPSNTPIFKGYVSAGLFSSGNPPTTAPFLDGWIFVAWDPSLYPQPAVQARLYNGMTGTYSPATVVGNGIWTYLDCIPGTGNQWNDFSIEIQSDQDEHIIETHGIVVTESYQVSAVATGQTPSLGARILGVSRGGGERVPVT